MIGNDFGGHCGVGAAVTGVDVLNDFLAVLMCEIDVDVGDFASFFGHETFEEQLHADRVHRGDAEGIADRRVRRRTAALAEYAEPAGFLHDIPNDEKVPGQIHSSDDAEFVFELAFDVGFERRAVALGGAAVNEFAQIRLTRFAFFHRKERKLSGDALEPETATGGDFHGSRDRFGMRSEQPAHRRSGFEVELGVGTQQMLGARAFEVRAVFDAT